MTIKIVCPVCKAANVTTPESTFCRRCREDLTLLYKVRGYSYKYRLYCIQLLANQNMEQVPHLAQVAYSLDKSFE
jgi:transposase-like protein